MAACNCRCGETLKRLANRVTQLEQQLNHMKSLKESESKMVGNDKDKQPGESWVKVVKGGKGGRGVKEHTVRKGLEEGIPTSNKFAALGEVERRVLVVGDSNVHRLKSPILNSVKEKNKITIVGVSGARVSKCEQVITTELAKVKSSKVKVIVNVGTNDVGKLASQEVLSKFKNLIRTVKRLRTGVDVALCTIPSRKDEGTYIYSRSESINNQLAKLCAEEGASVIDSRLKTTRLKHMLGWDGVHYTREGAQVVGSLIGRVAESFLE